MRNDLTPAEQEWLECVRVIMLACGIGPGTVLTVRAEQLQTPVTGCDRTMSASEAGALLSIAKRSMTFTVRELHEKKILPATMYNFTETALGALRGRLLMASEAVSPLDIVAPGVIDPDAGWRAALQEAERPSAFTRYFRDASGTIHSGSLNTSLSNVTSSTESSDTSVLREGRRPTSALSSTASEWVPSTKDPRSV